MQLKKYFTFEVQVLDDKNVRRRFRASNYQSTTRVKPFICTMPMRLDEGWNQIQFNLSDFTRRAYGSNYIETLRVTIHANCRIRRIYFSDRLYSEEELPPEFKLFLPIQKQQWLSPGLCHIITLIQLLFFHVFSNLPEAPPHIKDRIEGNSQWAYMYEFWMSTRHEGHLWWLWKRP